jgi:hypothetical protein
MREWNKTPKGRANQRAHDARYRATETGRAGSNARTRRYTKTEKGKANRRAHLEQERASGRYAARAAVGYHVKVGHIIKGPCVVCGALKVHAHHPRGYDAAHRLDVEWYCPKHHKEVHR